MNHQNILKDVMECYKAFSFFNKNLNAWIGIQTLILILSRSFVALFTLALSYFVNKTTSITLFETIVISVVSFYCISRIMEWITSAIHGRLHTQFVLPSALNFIDEIIYLMIRHYSYLKTTTNSESLNNLLQKNPVELSSLLNKKTEARGFLGFLFNHISTPILELIVCSFLLINIGFGWVGFLLIPIALCYLFISMQLMPKIKKKMMEVLSISAKSSSIFSVSLEKANLAASFGTTDLLVNHLKTITKKENEEFKESSLLNDIMATLLNLPLAVFACLFFYFGAIQVQNGSTTYGAFAALIAIVINSFSQLKNLTFAFKGLNSSLGSLKPHIEIFSEAKKITNIQKEKLTINNFISLKLENFQVSTQEKKLFNINLSLGKGEKIFIVGSSGVGKTSFTKALLGYKEYRGKVFINEEPIDLSQYPFSWLPQEYQAVEGTVKFNLSLGNADATVQEMLDALKRVNLYEKIMSIGGLDANLTYQGNNLSGGENQRLSLARCLLSINPILVLDEPSSALDMRTEKDIFKYIMNMEKSAFIIVHRLKAIPKGSTVLFLEPNQQYTLSSLEELLHTNEDFKKIYFSSDT